MNSADYLQEQSPDVAIKPKAYFEAEFNQHGVTVINSRDYQGLVEPNYAAFATQGEAVKKMTDVLINFLKTPYVLDAFTNHADRQNWVKHLNEQGLANYPDLLAQLEHNKLRTYSLGPVLIALEHLSSTFKKTGHYNAVAPTLSKALQAFHNIPEGKGNRMVAIETFEKCLVEFLNVVATLQQSHQIHE